MLFNEFELCYKFRLEAMVRYTGLIALIMLAGSFLVVAPVSAQYSGTFSGRIWNDINRNGIQDDDEPGISDNAIYIGKNILMCGCVPFPILGVFYTDADGYYNFSFATNHSFYVYFTPFGGAYGVSPQDVGEDDIIDSDFFASHHVTNAVQNYENMDLGLYLWNPGVNIDVKLNQLPFAQSLYITSGAPVTITYRVTNTGETYLSETFIYDAFIDEFVGQIECPSMIAPGEVVTFTTQLVVHASMTNLIDVFATSVNFYNCNEVGFYSASGVETVIIVDSWADNLKIQSVSDGGEFAFAEIEHAAGYQIQWKTNLLDEDWIAIPQPGISDIPSIGPGLRVTNLNLDVEAGFYRLIAVTNQ